MHSRHNHQRDHGHKCQERGRLGDFDRDSLLGDHGFSGLGGEGLVGDGLGGGGLEGAGLKRALDGGRFYGAHANTGREGNVYGLGREGRVRVDGSSSSRHRRRDAMTGMEGVGSGRFNRGLGGALGVAGLSANLGRGRRGGLGGGLLGGGFLGGGIAGLGTMGGGLRERDCRSAAMREGFGGGEQAFPGFRRGAYGEPFDELGGRGSQIGRGDMEAALLQGQGGMGLGGMGLGGMGLGGLGAAGMGVGGMGVGDMGISGMGIGGMSSRDRLGGNRSLHNAATGLLGGPRSPSGSVYNLEHLDRRPRPYHYQHPYVEDYDEQLDEEEMMNAEMMELMREEQMQGVAMYGYPGGMEMEDLIGGLGGMSGLGTRRARM